MAAYYELTPWLDHDLGRILGALDAAGPGGDTTVVHASDHGDNPGARGLCGKSNIYEERAAKPMIVAGPDVPHGVNETPVDLLDVAASICDHFGADTTSTGTGTPLGTFIDRPDPDRAVLSQYHAADAVSGAFMLRKGRCKLIRHIGFKDEMFDLHADPEETRNLATDPQYVAIRTALRAQMGGLCATPTPPTHRALPLRRR